MTEAPNPRLHPAEAECLLVGAMLLAPDCILDAAEIVTPGDFHLARCRMVFEAATAVYDRQVAVDFITVGQELTNRGHLAAVGGMDYLLELSALVTSASHARHHARLVAECSQLRLANRVCLEIATEAREDVRPGQTGEVSGFLERAERQLFEVGSRDLLKSEANPVATAMTELFEHLENPQGAGMPTGLAQLDDLLLGFRPGEFIIVAARPARGKTTLALNMSLNMAAAGHPGLFVTLEMTQLELMQRIVSRESGVSGYNLRRGRLDIDEMNQVREAATRLSEMPLSICDAAEMTPARLRALARRCRARGQLSWLVVDYVQLMSYPAAKNNRVQEVSFISRQLKLLAKEMAVPLIAVAQLSRAAEEVARPKLHHLRESGTLEQDADVVLLMWGEEDGPLKLDVAKNRHGATGTIELAWRKTTFSITQLGGAGSWSVPPIAI